MLVDRNRHYMRIDRKLNVPRVVVAGISGDSGKTTIATGIMGAFIKMGLDVRPFKVGPDYIDPSYHTAVVGKPSRNLDTWLTSSNTVLELFERASVGASVSVVEGCMGLHDGLIGSIEGAEDYAGTAYLAKFLKAPVILVVNIAGTARNAAAVVLGLKLFDRGVDLAGVVLDNSGDQRSVEWTKKFIESKAGVPVVGAVPFSEDIVLSSRHLGLIPVKERAAIGARLSRLVDHVSAHIDAEKLLEIALTAKELPNVTGGVYPTHLIRGGIKVGVAYDEAFTFFYQDSIDLLNAYGAETVFFSPLHDAQLPSDITGLYIPGGFPELHADHIAANQSMRGEIKKAANDGMPIFAESGGLTYLNRSITDLHGRELPMTGFFPGKVFMKEKFQALDYTLMKAIKDNLIGKKDSFLHGHEFHFSKIEVPRDAKFAFEMQGGKGIDGHHDGWTENNVLASFGHVHFAFDKQIPQGFIKHCKSYGHR